MIRSKVALRYAKAMLQLAEEAKESYTVFEDMQVVRDTIEGSKELRSMLHSPIVKPVDKKEALLSIFSSQSDKIKELIKVLVTNQRTESLGDVAASYVHLYNEAQGVKVAKVTTAVPLTSDLEAQVLSKVKEITDGSSVSIENIVDPEIIGGFILRVGDLQYNASIANQFGNLKREFSKSI